MFLLLKEFSKDPRIGLTLSTSEFNEYVIKCEIAFGTLFLKYYCSGNLGSILESKLNEIRIDNFKFCSKKIKYFFIKTFIRCRIYYILKFKNRHISKISIKRKVNNVLHKGKTF